MVFFRQSSQACLLLSINSGEITEYLRSVLCNHCVCLYVAWTETHTRSACRISKYIQNP